MTDIVLDTNVLISGMINAFGSPGRIVDRIREGGELQLVVDDRILAEYAAVLMRPKFRCYFKTSDACDIINFLEHNSRYIVPTARVPSLPDPDDIAFLEVAISADVPLVTGNRADFYTDQFPLAKIYTPAQFLEITC